MKFDDNDFSNVNLAGQNLTNTSFRDVLLIGANLTDAVVRGTEFRASYRYGAGLTIAQLSSTASYQAGDLSDIGLSGDFAGMNLAGQNLANARFASSTLAGANLNHANLSNVDFDFTNLTGADLSYANLTNAKLANDYNGSNLTNANLSHANLTGAILQRVDFTGANLAGAVVRGADFTLSHFDGGLSISQLYSTASYQARDLSGIKLSGNFAGVNLGGQNLSNAFFDPYANLSNADISQANLANAYLFGANLSNANVNQANLTSADLDGAILTGADLSYANLTNANLAIGYDVNLSNANLSHANLTGANFERVDFTGANLSAADSRGASLYLATLTGANTSNLIQPDGHIAGLDLTAGKALMVRDYDGNAAASSPVGPLPILVEQHFAMSAVGTLRLEFDADAWGSIISFAPGISVARGGTLELTFAPDVDIASQIGRTLDLFDWSGVTPSGFFEVESDYVWNLSRLYTTGEVTLTSVPEPGSMVLVGTALFGCRWRRGSTVPCNVAVHA